jgi:hypothetical protein
VISMRGTALLAAAMTAVPLLVWAQDDRDRYGHDGVRIRIGRSFHVPADTVQTEPLIVVGGAVTIDGRTDDEVVVVGGSIRVGPAAVVRGDLTAVGGTIRIDPRADVSGAINEANALWPMFGFQFPTDTRWWALAALALTMLRFALILLVAALVAALAPRWTQETARESGGSAALSLVTGWAAQLLFLPAVAAVTLALAFSVIGVPLIAAMPLLFMALACAWLAGFAGTAAQAGRAVRGRSGTPTGPSAGDAVVGVFALALVTFAGHLMTLGPGWLMPMAVATLLAGMAIEHVAWTVGLGAAVRVLLNRRRGVPLRATLQPAQ